MVHYHWGFAPHAKIRPLVVLAGAHPPGKRYCKTHGGPTEDLRALSPDELAARVLAHDQQQSRRLTWAAALKKAWKIDVLACPCGGRRRLIAMIDQPAVVKKILRHLGLPTEAIIGGDVVYQVRGPPEDMFPEDLDETGTEIWPADGRDPGESVDDLPEGDWSA